MTGLGNKIEIEVIIDPTKGTVESLTVSGVVGPKCKELTKPFEARFGGTMVDTPLPEMYEQEVVTQQARLGGSGL